MVVTSDNRRNIIVQQLMKVVPIFETYTPNLFNFAIELYAKLRLLV